MKHGNGFKDITGQVFGRYTVQKDVGGGFWLCRCTCGTEKVQSGKDLRSGNTQSCGCLSKEISTARCLDMSKDNRKHELWEPLPTVKLCECGVCGLPAPIAKTAQGGYLKGQPKRFIKGHDKRRPLAERLWEKVDKNGPLPSVVAIEQHPEIAGTRCWPWTGCVNAKGYGHILCERTRTSPHRVAFFLEYGFWPTPCGLHKCDNPPCCNPEHIFEGTDQDNADDRDAKGRHGCGKVFGEQHGMAKLTPTDVLEIRTLRAAGADVKELAKEYGVCKDYIYTIAAGKSWSHLSA